MKRAKSYPSVIRRWYHPIEHECAVCHRTLHQAMTLSRRTVVTLQAIIKLIHAGYRCPDQACPGRASHLPQRRSRRTRLAGFHLWIRYRSAGRSIASGKASDSR
ncbi:hypothetical protein [Reticulibacter mediterranei]|uniref:hypothetical protein n=1 Tax=Reticulibacter mediterranei TaxID=2778369 RepID=UPI001C68ECE6|nr:hypothetical protein [Reticulibacter mediterranei]